MSVPPSPPHTPGEYVIPSRYWAWLGSRRVLVVILWIAAITAGAALTVRALRWFNDASHEPPDRRRADGNSGHVQIDFGGQWVMGRMMAEGHGRELYHRQRQWLVVQEGYPVEDEAPIQRREADVPRMLRTPQKADEDWQHDATNLMNWFMGHDHEGETKVIVGAAVAPLAHSPAGNPFFAAALEKAAADAATPDLAAKASKPAVGGPLYPPVHAMFYAPIGMIDRPRVAYQIFQVLSALSVPFAALGVKLLSRGRIWWSVATLALFFYPGLRGGMDLGQNPTISLCIVVWGWVLASRGYNVAGGMVWGLFAFKPVWAAAFFLVPFLMGRWRFCLAMVGTGAALGLLTLPLVGIQSWFDWLKVGQDASELYKVNDNWIHLSRDLQGIPRRMLLDFEAPQQKRESPLANTLAWGLWGAVFGATVIVYLLRANRKQPTGVGAGFLFLGAHLTCFHFMYYDSLISAAALAVLFADPRPFFRTKTFALEPAVEEPRLPAGRGLPSPPLVRKPLGARMIGYVNSFPLTVVALLFVVENSLAGLEVEATFGVRQITYFTATGASAKSPVIRGDTSLRYPLDTFLLMALWAWCGWRLLRDRGGPEA